MSMLHLPIEVLHRILEYVPEPEDRDVWLSSMVNTAMLLPISQTCRRLRDITISHSALWQSLKIGDRVEPKARGLVQDALARSRSRSLNLDLSLSSCEENDATWTHTKSLRPEVAARVRELQIFLTSKRVDHPWDPVFDRAYPHLDSFSFYDVTEDTVLTHFPPFTENSSSRLRRLYLRVVVALPQSSSSC
ncbi:hypothetical protein C8T65DRAFT_744594 [Cerioporus squamosus]|nr:hypothetical protein C8T65DRAFT_744594 [Cerioporus squamosus]